MIARVLAIAMNAFREAVRAWVLLGLLGLALATAAGTLVIASLSLHQEARVIADLGAASISLYAVIVAIVLGATSLYRELELKTVFPILTRKLRRHEYVIGKYLGTLATMGTFVAIDGGAVLGILALSTGQKPWLVITLAAILGSALAIGLYLAKQSREPVLFLWSIVFFVGMALLAQTAGGERQLVIASIALTMCEVAIVTAVANLFAAFSSPFLTAIFTFGVFLVGRSADTLGNLPSRVFGEGVHDFGHVLSRIFPNLNVYVPARPLLLGQVDGAPTWPFVAHGAMNALFYTAILVTLSALVFRKRDFQ